MDKEIGWPFWSHSGDSDHCRKIEGIFLGVIQKYLATRKKIKICSIGCGQLFNELVITALLLAIMKVPVDLLLCDKDGDHDLERAAPAFIRYLKQWSPDSTVEIKIGYFDKKIPTDIDAFISIDALSWKDINQVVGPYMQRSPTPTLTMTAWTEPYELVYCQGNNTPLIGLSYEQTSKTGIRPSYAFTTSAIPVSMETHLPGYRLGLNTYGKKVDIQVKDNHLYVYLDGSLGWEERIFDCWDAAKMTTSIDDAGRLQLVIPNKEQEDDYHRWGKSVSLSPQTKQMVIGQKDHLPVDFTKLSPLTTDQRATLLSLKRTGDAITLRLGACQRPTVDILVDRQHLHVHIHDARGAAYFDLIIPEGFDGSQGSASLDDTGVLTILIPSKR